MPSVIVVGGGVIGCATAYYLVTRGADVTLLERGEISSEASGAAAGILASLSDHGEQPPFYHDLCAESLRLFDEVLPRLAATNVNVLHREADILEVALSDAEITALREQFDRQQPRTNCRWLDGRDAIALEPRLSPRTRAAVLTPRVRYLDPQRLTQAFAAAAKSAGATIREHEPVSRFLRRGDRLRGVRTPDGTCEADEVLIAGGPWTTALGGKLGANVPVRPVRGQMLSLDGPATPLGHIVLGPGAFALPREDGQTYVGATVEEAGFRKQTTAVALRRMENAVARIVPSLSGARRRKAWAGLRPATPDALPAMGRLPGWRNAWVSGGHFRTGSLLSPLSGKLMADAILDRSEAALPPQLSPGRFA